MTGFESEIRPAGVLVTAILGVLAAIALRFRAALLLATGLLAGLRYGLGNGVAMTTHTARHLFTAGVLAGVLLAFTPVVAFITTLHQLWQQTAVRVVASWIAASRLRVIAFHLRGLSPALTGGRFTIYTDLPKGRSAPPRTPNALICASLWLLLRRIQPS